MPFGTDSSLEITNYRDGNTADPQTVTFTSKGQVVIPAKLRRHDRIAAGTRVVVTDTKEGILLKPITTEYIRSLRGSMKGKEVLKALAKDKKKHWSQEIPHSIRWRRKLKSTGSNNSELQQGGLGTNGDSIKLTMTRLFGGRKILRNFGLSHLTGRGPLGSAVKSDDESDTFQ